MLPHAHRKTYLEQLPLIALVVVTSVALLGVYYLWAHPASQGLSVDVNGSTILNPYYYTDGQLPDLDNCPGGPNAKPCYDEFGVQISCYNPNQADADADRIGDICDPTFDTPPPPVCGDGLDNDVDGFCDLAGSTCTDGSTPGDPGCSSAWDTDEHGSNECDDGIDNDQDGRTDYNTDPLVGDAGCANLSGTDETNCGDGVCEGGEAPGVGGCAVDCGLLPICSDGLDNDGDGLSDLADPGCADANDTDEHNSAVACDNGTDDDGDTKTDFPADPGCASQTDTNECNDVDRDNYFAELSCAGSPANRDCNDNKPNISPGKTEICNDAGNLDENCSGFANCVDFGCAGKPGPSGAVCCADDSSCGICSACDASKTCQAQTSADGHLASSDCTYCDAGTLRNRPAGARDECPAGPPQQQCNAAGVCEVPAACSNGADEDGDGRTDYPDDLGCTSLADTSECNDLDRDNYFAESSCSVIPDCNDTNANVNPGKAEVCDDAGNLDEDCKNGVNCTDASCAAKPGPTGAICCQNDTSCTTCYACDITSKTCQAQTATEGHLATGPCTYCVAGTLTNRPIGATNECPTGPPQQQCNAAGTCEVSKKCSNHIDDDGDGLCDTSSSTCTDGSTPGDPGCSSAQDDDEHGTTQCDNGADDDGDGRTDYRTDPALSDSGCTGPGDTTEANCGDAVINQSSEQCEGYVNLPGTTTYTTALGVVKDFRQYQLDNRCITCGSSGAQACQTLTYRNCASLADGQPYILPTPFAWVVNTTSLTGHPLQSISQMVTIKNPAQPYNIGTIIHEYRVCRNGISPAYTYDFQSPQSPCPTVVSTASNLAVNLELNEVWVTYYNLSIGLFSDLNGVAFISDTVKRYCPTNGSMIYYPFAVAIDQAGDAWVAAQKGSSETALLRFKRDATDCAYDTFNLSPSLLIDSGGKLSITPTGDLWMLSNTGTMGIHQLTYIANPGQSNWFIRQQSLSSVLGQDILVETDSSVLVSTYNKGLKKYKYDPGSNSIMELSYTPSSEHRHAATFWPHWPDDLSSIWTAYTTSGASTYLIRYNRATGQVEATKPAFTSLTLDISASSDGKVWSENHNMGQLISFDVAANDAPSARYQSYCGKADPFNCNPFSRWNMITGNDFLGFKRALVLGGNTLFYPALSNEPLTAFDVATTDPESRNSAKEDQWGKVRSVAVGTIQVYVCFSDTIMGGVGADDVNCSGGGSTGWVKAEDYNAAFNDPKYRKQYLRIKAVKDPSTTVSSIEISCKDAAGNDVCLP